MFVSSGNIYSPNAKPNKISKPVTKNGSLPELRVLDYLSHSSNSVNGCYISFKSERQNADAISKRFFETNYFPDDERVPDGFKMGAYVNVGFKSPIDSKSYIFQDPEKNQITIVNRKKDKALQKIFQEYKSMIPHIKREFENISNRPLSWQEQFAIEEGKMQKLDWQTFLINRTKSYVSCFAHFHLEESVEKLEKLNRKETYLGEIIKSGIGVCRHDALLFKLLMETQSIPVACQSGFRIDHGEPYKSMICGHVWNIIKNGNIQHIADTACSRTEEGQYLDNNLDYLYVNKSNPLSLEEKFKQDILDLQPGQTIKIGLDKKGNIVTDKTNPLADFGLKLIWNEEDKFELHKLKETVGQRSITYNNYPDNKISTLKDRIYIWYENTNFTIWPNDIRCNFNRQAEKAYLQLSLKYNFKPASFFIEDYVKINPALDSRALEIFSDFKDIGIGILKNRFRL